MMAVMQRYWRTACGISTASLRDCSGTMYWQSLGWSMGFLGAFVIWI
jgi:hypothetical protein